MKYSICFTLFCCLAFWPALTQATPYQDLDRIGNIVEQARNLAAGAKASATSSQPQATPLNNPFATPAGTDVPNVVTPNVAIDDSEIRIYGIDGLNALKGTNMVDGASGALVIPRLGAKNPGGNGIAVGTPPNTAVGKPGAGVSAHLATAESYRRYSAAVTAFRNSNFHLAVNEMSLVKLPQDQQLAISPFQSLCHFATGNYKKSAAFAYATAARTPLWSWQNLQGFYGNPQSYPAQYLALQTAAKRPDCDASTLFLAGYHHLMLGHRHHAAREFNRVLKLLPNDPVTKALLTVAAQGPPMPMN